jgi:hypothetical protein
MLAGKFLQALGVTKKSQKTNLTLFTEPVGRIFWGNIDFLVSHNSQRRRRKRD